MYVIRRSLIFDSIVSCQIVFSNIFVAFQQMNWLKSNALSWEQRKAVDIADYSKGNGYSKSDLIESGTPIILYGRLYTKYQFAIDEVDTFATPKDGSIYSQGNEVIIPASGETAEDIARASAVEKSGILLGGDLNILRPFNFINPLFLALTISNGEPQKELAKKAQGKSVVHIHNSDIQEVTVSFPIRAEQDRIVAVFRSLDNLITLHQSKAESWKNKKNRFLTISWEQRKLSSIAEEVTRTAPESTAPVMMITANNGFIEQSDRYAFNNAGESLKKYILLEKGEMAYNHGASKLRPYGSCFALTTAESARIPFVYHCFSVGDNDPEFVSMELNGSHVENQLRRIVSSGARMDGLLNISYEEYASVEFMMPSIPEQHTLADYFRQLDILITLHQSKLERIQMCNYRSILYGSF